MNLHQLSDTDLLENTDRLVRRERELLAEILRHLKEIERRRLFSELGYKSLFEYATKRLGYADDQAARRISAMRLLRELPELEPKITSGALTLTNLGMAQTLFRQAKKSVAADELNGQDGFCREGKLALLNQLENKSKRQAEKIICSYSTEPERLRPDRIRHVTEAVIEFKFTADVRLNAKIENVKGLLAHSQQNMSLAEVINWLCDVGIQKLNPAEKPARRSAPPAPALKRRGTKRRFSVSAAIKQQLWQRARGKCQNCGSTYALQIDHRRPVALGGTNDQQNLRLLCRSCNQRAEINSFGLMKMLGHFSE